MIKFNLTNKFKKDLTQIKPEIFFSAEWLEILDCLRNKKPFSKARKDHPMKGEWSGCRDCHINGDLVLIYERSEEGIILHRIGSHSKLKILKEK